MIHNPRGFFKEPRLLNRIGELQNDDVNKLSYLKAIQINLQIFTTKHINILKSFINNQIYPDGGISLSQPFFNSSIKRELLLMMLLELSMHQRKEQQCSLHQIITEQESNYFQKY